MFTARTKGRLALGVVAVGVSVALAGCASGDPLSSGSGSDDSGDKTITIGSQAYYSNEIIAEIYAEALENAGWTVKRQFQIGQRDAYLPELESGDVDLIPEYTGNLLQYFDKDTTEKTSDDVYAALGKVLPKKLEVLDQSGATDQDSYNVTKAYATANNIVSIADLAGKPGLVLGGNAELESRPYGVKGLKDTYNVDVTFKTIGDSGGPLTVQALKNGDITVGNIYSADPNIATSDLVTLQDPKGLFLASNVVPLVNKTKGEQIKDILNPIDAALSTAALVSLNGESVNDKKSSADIAKGWLAANGYVKK